MKLLSGVRWSSEWDKLSLSNIISVRAWAPFTPEEENVSISKMLFVISDYRPRSKSINPLALSVTNKVLFNVALGTAERPVSSAAMHNPVQFFCNKYCRVKRNSKHWQYNLEFT